MQSFLDVVLPPLLLAAFGLFLCTVAAVLALARMRLWAARRRRVTGAREALSGARDALAAVISDPGLGASTRDQAVTAYQAVSTAITKENDHQ
jgi:transcription initiation factor TFIIIB Brf1 subunit/transcription initiation factor TFIIB